MNKVTSGNNKYCGPAVLSILTGKSVDVCASAILAVRGNITKNVTSVQIPELVQAAERLRVEIKEVDINGYSLYAVLTNLASARQCGVYLVSLPKHVVCVEVKCPETTDIDERVKITFNDNHTKTEIDAAGSARLSQRVDKLFLVKALPPPELVKESFNVARSYEMIYINKSFTYRDERDNHSSTIGSIRLKSETDFDSILRALTHFRNYNDLVTSTINTKKEQI